MWMTTCQSLYLSFISLSFLLKMDANCTHALSRIVTILEGFSTRFHSDSFLWCEVELLADLSQSSKASERQTSPKILETGCAKPSKREVHSDTIPRGHVDCDKNTPSHVTAKKCSTLPGVALGSGVTSHKESALITAKYRCSQGDFFTCFRTAVKGISLHVHTDPGPCSHQSGFKEQWAPLCQSPFNLEDYCFSHSFL